MSGSSYIPLNKIVAGRSACVLSLILCVSVALLGAVHATPTLQIAPVAVLASEQPGSVTENRRTIGSKVATAPLSAYNAMTPLGLAPKELPTCPDCAEKQFTC